MDDRPLGTRELLDRLDLRPSALLRRVGAVLAVVVIAVVGWWLLRPAAPPVESIVPLESSTTVAPAAATTTTVVEAATTVVAAAAGAVEDPGVYRLDPGARIIDLVDAAGGFTDEADPDRVNLAAVVNDGERVWVPARGDQEVPEVVSGTGGGGPHPPPPRREEPEALIDLNRASEAELEELPGVGPATAAAIAAHRSEVGPFGSVEDLLDVRGIGEAKLALIRPLATV